MEDRNMEMARQIAQAVAADGGHVYYVGGLVRDRIIGRENKDIDVEVHGVSADRLYEILKELGHVMEMGASFGILGLKGYELDIAMPRSERATGRGHKDFAVTVDPFLGEEKAALRRDFTMNALMQDVLTGEILDFFGGQEDIRRRLIRHVNDTTFAEDPLRVLRACQFAARFDYRIAPETLEISRRMDLKALAKERIMGEMEKALLKADRPSVFFEELRRMRQLDDWFPELKSLIRVPQDPFHHPEGNVWNHTMLVLDEAAKLRDDSSWPLGFMMAALTHDFGKITATSRGEDGRWHSYDHERKGQELIHRFIGRLTAEKRLQEYVLNMAFLHMRPNMLARQGAGVKSYMKTFDASCCPEDLLLLSKADHLGRRAGQPTANDFSEEGYREVEALLRDRLALYHQRMSLPFVQGRDLIANGARPGPAFTDALDYAHKLRLAGVPKDQALPQVMRYLETLQA